MNREDIIDGIIDILSMSEMSVKSQDSVIEASIDNKKFRITVEELN